MPNAFAYFIVLLFLVSASAKIIATDFHGFIRPLIRQYAALSYFQADGTITQSEISTLVRFHKAIKYKCNIQYDYTVNGRLLTSRRVRYFDDPMFIVTMERGGEIVTAYPKGFQAKVFYNPMDPADALLSPGVIGDDLINYFGHLFFYYIAAILGGTCLLRIRLVAGFANDGAYGVDVGCGRLARGS